MLLLGKSNHRHLGSDSAVNPPKIQRTSSSKAFTIISSMLALALTLASAPPLLLAGDADHDRDQGGQVLPGPAKPRGYSLSDMAKATAFFNTGSHDLTFYPDTPFQILFIPPGTPDNMSPVPFDVGQGTMLYVPIFYADDSPPVTGDFPDVHFRQEVLRYVYSPTELGTIYIKIVVDGAVHSLGSDLWQQSLQQLREKEATFVVGVGHVKLGDGPGGAQEPRIGSYIVRLSDTVEQGHPYGTSPGVSHWCSRGRSLPIF